MLQKAICYQIKNSQHCLKCALLSDLIPAYLLLPDGLVMIYLLPGLILKFLITVLPQHCESDGKIYNIGDEWRPSPFSVCKCVAPSAVACSLSLPCFDHQFNQRQPGDRWLENPTTNCTCTQHSLVLCQILNEPICMDISGNLRKNGETWMNGSCVACQCVNGTINCTGYDVNVTYGLYSVELLPTCEKCAVPLKTVETFSACKGEWNI